MGIKFICENAYGLIMCVPEDKIVQFEETQKKILEERKKDSK